MSDAPVGDAGGAGSRVRILLVEDADAVRQTLTAVLQSRGFVVVPVGTAEQAIDLARAERFDFLLTDVVLPGQSGPALAVEFRRQQPGVPILFMSGFSHGALRPEDLDTPRAFLQKPFRVQVLVERIRELLAWARDQRLRDHD